MADVDASTACRAANAVKLGSADGAIIWDSVAAEHPGLKVMHLPHLDRVTADVTAAVCRRPRHLVEGSAFHLLAYLLADLLAYPR
ncbi:MAG: hypothetical protein J2P46_15675 [Zavarzinella sp.]|nr:hypothetical protein [Zavarzinella sp.]